MIGLFDSGSGGLSVLRALRARAPHADVVYFGDIAHAPYGEKSPKELEALARAGIAKLKTMRAGEIIAACNSIAPSVLAHVARDVPIIEMTRPTAHVLEKYGGKRLLLIATPATIYSEIYQHAVGEFVTLETLPIPELAGAIEFGASAEDTEYILRSAFEQQRGKHYDALILGCTHYPLVRPLIEREAQKVFGTIELIDPAEAVADDAAEHFNIDGGGKLKFYVSKNSTLFRSRVGVLFPNAAYTIEVV